MQDRAFANDKIKFVWNSRILEVLGDSEVTGIKVENNSDHTVSEIPCQGLFVALGHAPATELVANWLELDENKYVKLFNNTSQTSLKGVFAAGDCADPRYRQAITAAGSGARAAIDAERYLE